MRPEVFRRFSHGVLIERLDLGAVGTDSFGDPEAQIPGDEVFGLLQVDVETLGLPAATEVRDVPEALRREQTDDRAIPLNERIRRHRLAVNEELRVAEELRDVRPRLIGDAGQPARDREERFVRRGVLFVDVELTIVSQQDEVGEGTADIDSDAVSHD